MPILHPDNLTLAVPENRIDQIVDIKEGSFSVGAGVTDAFNEVTQTTADSVGDSWKGALYLMKGIWSHDGGASWHEFGNTIVLGAYASGLRTLQVSISMFAQNGIDAGSGGQYDVSATNTGSAGYTIDYKILFMARPDQLNIPLTALKQALRYSSKYKYMKILLDDHFVAPTAGTTVIPHNLGYVPNVNAWIYIAFSAGDGGGFEIAPLSGGSHGGGFSADNSNTIDAYNLTFHTHRNPSFEDEVRVYYRVYLDA